MAPKRNLSTPNSRQYRGPSSSPSRRGLVELPRAGCTLPVPDLPPGREWSDAEAERWKDLWQSPQATQWDDAAASAVGVLVCYESKLYSDSASAWHAAEWRHAATALGLTPQSMAALGWTMEEDRS